MRLRKTLTRSSTARGDVRRDEHICTADCLVCAPSLVAVQKPGLRRLDSLRYKMKMRATARLKTLVSLNDLAIWTHQAAEDALNFHPGRMNAHRLKLRI